MNSRVFLLAILALFLVVSPFTVRADDIEVDDPDVTRLTKDNFDAFIQQDLVLVEFYAPWCGHCKQLAPEYAKAATALKKTHPEIKLGKLDATKEGEIAGRYGINGYPTLKIIRNGKASDYNGPRQADGIASYMRKQVGPAAKPVTSLADLEKLKELEPEVGYVVLGLFNADKTSQLQSSFNINANKMRDEFVFGKATNAEMKAALGVEGEAIVAFLKGEKIVYSGGSKTSEVESFIRTNSVALVGEYSEKTSSIYTKRGLPVATLFLKVDKKSGSKTMTYYTNRLKKIAEQFKNKVAVAYADRDGQKGLLEHLNMQDEEHGFFINDVNSQKFYKFEDEDESPKKKNTLNVAGWTKFVEEFVNGEARVYKKSQRAPKVQGPVKIVTGNNFDELVEDEDKDVFIEFYAPWCGHCKQLEPKYNQLGEKFKNQESIVIGKLDATANDWDRSKYEVKGYPTIFFKAAGKKPVVYEGAREVDAMASYIKKNAKTLKKKKD